MKFSFEGEGGRGGGGGLGPLFLNFLDPPLEFMDHLSETGDKQLLLSYLNLKSVIKISLKEEFVHTKFTHHLLLWRVVTYRLVDTFLLTG